MKLDYEKRQEVNRLMEAAQDDLEGVIFELVGQLAAERTGRADDFRSLSETNLQLRQQLAAEREKYEAACEGRDQFKAQLSDADKQLRKGSSLEASHQTFNELVHDNQQLREQLAAERNERAIVERSRDAWKALRRNQMSDQDKPAGEQDAVQKIMQHAMSHTGRFLNEFTVSEIINAALTAERERLENDEVHRQQAVQEIYAGKLADLEEQLAAEREKTKLAKSTITQIPMFNENALRATIAEAQQPLVDALKRIARQQPSEQACIAEVALAKLGK